MRRIWVPLRGECPFCAAASHPYTDGFIDTKKGRIKALKFN
ncbi:hypothetical protein CLOSTMETH_03405 [[Clostridium] methylpentosum DSM 5476]|uniref:Uncharacterized protein n=1 Tax=[Clostridium] methylpentosum DSM 5476 TaxID=537013 RepID=C0EHR0_9FIRM|nr:hypothetical protein CLOSTMETH_03405 [[Clostridium] methylpentosum DSM 5476]